MGRKAKIDTTQLIALANQKKPNGKPLSHSDIAKELRCSRVAVTKALANISPTLLSQRDTETFVTERADILAELQQTLIRYVTPEKLKRASLSQIVTAMAILYDKERLERHGNERGGGIAIQINLNDLNQNAKEMLNVQVADKTQKLLQESLRQDTKTYY